MSKSLKRVKAALDASGVDYRLEEMTVETRTAQQAADAVNCAVDQIAKSMIMASADTLYLFVTAGGRMVDAAKASALAGQDLSRPDADRVRKVTGFAVGGVAPIGHLSPISVFFDETLLEFPNVWAAGGTPRHVFEIRPQKLLEICNGVVAAFST